MIATNPFFGIMGMVHLNVIIWLQDVGESSVKNGTMAESSCAIKYNFIDTEG